MSNPLTTEKCLCPEGECVAETGMGAAFADKSYCRLVPSKTLLDEALARAVARCRLYMDGPIDGRDASINETLIVMQADQIEALQRKLGNALWLLDDLLETCQLHGMHAEPSVQDVTAFLKKHRPPANFHRDSPHEESACVHEWGEIKVDNAASPLDPPQLASMGVKCKRCGVRQSEEDSK